MNVDLPEWLSGKTIAIAAVVLVAVSLFFLVLPAVNVNQNYSVSFGSAALEKNVTINGSQHIEEFEVRQGDGLALFVVVPKKLADNASKISGISHNANLNIVEIDPILKFSHKEESPFWAKLEFDSVNEDICTISLLLPESYLDSIDRSQLEELKVELLGYGEMNPTCEEAKEIERELATELESVFAEDAELKGLEEEAGLVLQLGGPKHGLVLSALKGVKTRANARRQAATQPSVTQPLDSQEKMPMISIFFEEGPEKLKENYQGVLREKYTLLKNKGPINLTVSSQIPESYYSTYLVYPEPVSTGPKPVLDFEKPKVEIKGINPDYFKIKISGDKQPYLLELEFTRGTNELPLEPLSGEILFDYKEIWPSSPIKIPINVWGNPCKSSIEEKATNLETYGELLDCYEAETRKAKMGYMAEVQNKRKALDEQVQEISKSPKVIFISPARLNDVFKRFEKEFNYSQIASGLKAGKVTEFQDELEVAEYRWLAIERDDLEFAKTRYDLVLRAIDTENFLCNYLGKEESMQDAEGRKQLYQIVKICSSLSFVTKNKFFADARLLNDPFSETNRKAYVKATVDLQKRMSQIQKENSKLCGPEPCNPDLFVISSWEAQLLEKKLFDNLDTHYGSNKELIKKLEGEVSDLQAKIKYLEGIKPTWKGYLNPLVLLGTGLEAVGDLIFEGGKVSISREEYEKQISDEILDLKSQITAINAVVVELGRENSLIGIYSRIREGFKGKTFKEASKEGVIIYAKNSEDPLKGASNNEAVIYAENLAYFSDQSNDPTGTNRLLKMWHGFYNNSTLRGELRKQRMLLGKDFLENIEEANLLYNTIHALEMERDSVLALEIILDKQKYEAEHGKPWREANLIGGIARLIDPGQEEPISKATTLIFNLSRERRGIKKILEQLRTGVPLLDIFETNWNYGPIHRLDYGVPKVINPDLTFLLKGAKKGTEDMEIEAFIGGLDVGTSPVAVGKTIGFTGAPGLLIKAEGEKGSGFTRSVDISFFVDEDYARYFPNPEPTHGFPFNATSNERLNRIVPGKGNLEGVRSGVFETTNPNVLIAIRISKGEKLNVEDIRSSDQIAVVDIKTALFEKSAVSKEKAEELVAYDKHLDMIYKLAEKNGGRAETHRFYLYYYLGADGSARRMDGELMTQGFGHNQGTVKQRVLRNSNIYSSTKFPGLAFRFDWNSKNEELTFYNHYSDLAALWKKQKADSVIAKGVEKEEDKTEDTAKVTEAKKDSLILAGLNNVSVYTQVHVRKMLLEDEKVSDEEFASLLFMTAKRYERFSLWQEALSVYTQIDDTFPSTPQSKLAIAQRAEVDYYVGAGQFVSFLEGLTSIESAVHYVLIAGVVKVIGRVVQLTKVTRVANVAKVQPAAQASEALTTPSKLLTGTTSKWSKVKAFFNYPLEDLIARPIAKGITSYRNFKIARAIRTAEQAPSAIAKVVSKPYAVDVSAAASSKSVQIGEANLRVVRTSKASFYQSPGGSVMVTNDATALADAALKTKKAVAALKYLEKVGRVPTGSANMFKNVGSMLDDALLHATPSVSTGTTLVAVPQSELQALSLFEEAMQPIILTSATGSATTVVQMAEGLAGRTGVFASVWYSSPVVGGEVKALPLLLYKRFLPYEEPLFYKGIGDVTGVPMFVMKESAAFSGTKVLLFETAQGRSFYQAANDLMGLDVEGIFFERFYYPRTTSHVEQLRLVIIHEMTHKWQASLSGTQQDTLLTAFLDHVVLDEKAAALAHLTPDLYLIKANSPLGKALENKFFETTPETLKVGELAIVDFPTGLGWGFTILKKTASGDYIDITKVVTELMAEQAAFGGHAGVKLPNEVLGEMRKAGFFGVDFDVAINEVMAEVAKMPRYANYFKPPKTVSPSANGIVTPAQCSCVVNIPVQGNEVIIYSSPRPGLDQLVKFEKVTNMGKISTRATVNTAAGENITQIAIGSVEGGAIVQMPALNGKVTAGTNPGLQITDVDFEAINQVRITVSDQLNSAAEATLVQQGGEKILFIKARKLDNIVLSGKDAVPVTTVTIPVPTVNTIPQLDPKLVEGWLSADAGAFGKVVRQKVLDNVRRVSFNDFSTELTANTKRLNTVLAETDEPFAVLLEFRPSKSRRWVFDLAKDSFTKKPSVVTYMPHPMESFSKVAQRATDKKINTFVIMDDATYTGLATDASNSITMRSIKKVSDWYKTMMPTVKPKFIVSMPYATKESTAFFEAFPDASVRVVNNTKMKTLGEILTSDELKYIEALDPSSAGRVVTTFDHKLPDAASHAKPVSELYFEGAKSPYKIPGTEYFESEQLDFYNWYRYGRFVDETQSTALPAPNVKDVLPPNFESSWAQPQQEAFLRNLIQDIRTNSANYPREFVTRATQQYDEIVAGWLEN